MAVDTSVGLLRVITAAVTPVVMISAVAALILGVNQKHTSMSDRLRALMMEFRATDTTAERREAIQAQVRLFHRRFVYVSFAHRWLYASIVCFIGMVMVITLTARDTAWDRLVLILFLFGVGQVLAAVVAELMELRLSGQTVGIEIQEALNAERPSR